MYLVGCSAVIAAASGDNFPPRWTRKLNPTRGGVRKERGGLILSTPTLFSADDFCDQALEGQAGEGDGDMLGLKVQLFNICF